MAHAGWRRATSLRAVVARVRNTVLAVAAGSSLAAAALAERRRRLPPPVAEILGVPSDDTSSDPDGAVRSIQGADLAMPTAELDRIWTPRDLERLARTYWRFLTRFTLGLVRVVYTETTRTVVLLFPFLPLLRFEAPEYRMDATRGIVRWRIADGLLVAKPGHGHLEIDMRRCGAASDEDARERVHVDVEVAAFYPAIASRIGRWVYEQTQSRIHIVITYGFLRSLARLDLAESKVGRFADVDDVPDPPPVPAPSGRPAPV
jgi:hypothetical protein